MSMPNANIHENKTFATLIECLEQITDPRMQGKITYPLVSIALMAICATIGSANNWIEVEQFCIDHEQWFIESLNITCRIPSHDTFNRVFNIILPSELIFWLTLWIENALPALTEKDILHLDGKVLEAYGSSHPLTLVRAWSERFHCTVGMVKVQNDSNEITALPHLIEMLYIKGKIITIDAIGAQKKIVSLIAQKGGDYVITLKANQHQF